MWHQRNHLNDNKKHHIFIRVIYRWKWKKNWLLITRPINIVGEFFVACQRKGFVMRGTNMEFITLGFYSTYIKSSSLMVCPSANAWHKRMFSKLKFFFAQETFHKYARNIFIFTLKKVKWFLIFLQSIASHNLHTIFIFYFFFFFIRSSLWKHIEFIRIVYKFIFTPQWLHALASVPILPFSVQFRSFVHFSIVNRY